MTSRHPALHTLHKSRGGSSMLVIEHATPLPLSHVLRFPN
jgi:hypothetical protein